MSFSVRKKRIISIHAPTRGATSYSLPLGCNMIFQSTLPQGERLQSVLQSVLIHQFQSTLPQGERRSSSVRSTDPQQFQSTLPQGERQRRVECLCGQNDHFNPRSHKGSDILQPEPASCRKNFNPRSHKGSDILVRLPCKAGDNFNPRSHKGSDAVPGYSAK